MPFKSKAQQRFLYATEPAIAAKFAEETTNFKKLPEYVEQKKKAMVKVKEKETE